jgi:hypothetical protein
VSDASRPNVVADPDVSDAAAGPSDNTTLLEVIRSYEDAGFTGQFGISEEGLLQCYTCNTVSPPARASLHSLRRMEGASDPADMLAVLAITCPQCSAQGTVVVHYGPESEPGESAVLLALDDHRGDDVLPAASGPTENRTSG